MSAVATTRSGRTPGQGLAEALGQVLRRPAEGWLTLIAAVAMIIAVGASLVNAGWTPGFAGDSGFLLYVGGVGLAFGFIGAKLGWGRWRTHLVGALFAGLFLPLIAGGLLLEAQGTPVGWDPRGLALRMDAIGQVAQGWWTDIVVLRLGTTSQAAHYHMIFGALVWGGGLLAGYTIFGHRRPLDAVVVLGLVLLANMAVTQNDQEVFLVAFSAAALALLIRTHVFEEEVTWVRRKIGDPAAVGELYLKGGAVFVAAAVLGSVVLMSAASSKPLQGLWQDLPRHLQGLSQLLQAIAPQGGNPINFGGTTFGSSATSRGVWTPAQGVAFRAQLPEGEEAEFKWRAGTYAQFNLSGWSWGATTPTEAAAGAGLLAGAADEPTRDGRRPITLTVSPETFRDATILGPNAIQSVDVPTVAHLLGTGGWFASVESREGVQAYQVTAWIREGLTEAQLRTASRAYPNEVRIQYLQGLSGGAMGPNALELIGEIRADIEASGGDPTNAYDLARGIERYLSSPEHFQYDPDILDERQACGSASVAECFAIIRRGYCEYYATTMAVLLRHSDVPARIAYGFLSAASGRDENNVEEVQGSLAHWWVEAYFPGYGWVEFDPTGGVGQPAALPSGSLGPVTPRPSFSIPPRNPSASIPGGGPINPNDNPTGPGIGPFIAIALILMVGVGALALASYRRVPSRPMHPDQAWGSLARLAARFGLGPRPSQTVYEYAGALGDEVPAARVELTTIARAKVEVAYGRQTLETDRLQRIALAYHRLRLALWGVILRRGLRRGRDKR